ncbi:hypothetical protein GCM10027047_33850 [Rhodococcus aerolatus]
MARHKILTVLGVLVVLGIIIGVSSSGGSSGGGGGEGSTAATGSGATSTAAPAAEDAPGIGTPVRDGKFEFTVTAVEPPVPSVGDGPFSETAQGEYVVVRLDVTNVGDRQQLVDQSAQKLIDAQGRQLSPDTGATFAIDTDNAFTEVNPGNSVQVALVYDVPVGTTPTTLELHDSAFSGGTEVSLT